MKPIEIKVTKVQESKVSSLDFDNMPFGKCFSDHFFITDFDGKEWVNPEIRPLERMETHPANLAWHYGQAVFEGMKASKNKDGIPMLFRPEMHAKRLNTSANRLCMPSYPEEYFLEAVKQLVSIERDWIPPVEGSALYMRPFMIATDEFIGVRPSTTYRFMIFVLPVGPYYSTAVSLKASTEFARAIPGGTGFAKAAGNYAATLYPAKLAREEGFDQIMWLDAVEHKYVQEVGTMNIFFVLDETIVTPAIDGCILEGITRDSVLQLLQHKGYKVQEKPVLIDDLIAAYDEGKLKEVFGTGTAAVVSFVKKISYKNKTMVFNPDNYEIAPMIKSLIDGIRWGTEEDVFNWTHQL